MKTRKALLLTLFFILLPFIASCVKYNDNERPILNVSTITTKAEATQNDDYFVSIEDISNYVSFKSLEGLSRNENRVVENVIPVKWKDATCLYILQYEKGFEVISADKRSPLPLMKDDNGVLESPTEADPMGYHILTLAEDVWLSLYHNDLLGKPDQETIENMESSLFFWKLISGDFDAIRNHSLQTKSQLDTIILDPDHGHWQFVGVTTTVEAYDTVNHMTTTWWHQQNPFNNYCPFSLNSLPYRCPAGCAAIAGAQLLYYLHYKIGVPTQSPSTGSCSGFVETGYTQSFGDYSSGTWDQMRSLTDPYHYAAMLVGDIGKKVHMYYSSEGSGTTLEALRDSALYSYGIQCSTYNYYNGNILRTYLSAGVPLLCSGFDWSIDELGDTTVTGHAFLVDGYIRSRQKMTLIYEWVFDDPGQSPGYQIIKTTVQYNAPYITMYQMNWGQGYGYSYNDTWCGMNGVWQMGNYTFNHNRSMLCNFRPLEE